MISPNFDDRPAGALVDHLVLHYTGMQSADAAKARLCDPAAKVSAHYLVEENGSVLCLVPEQSRAWHAGVSYWRGVCGLNDRSIGIELVNPGHELGYTSFSNRQIESLIRLCAGILARHPIPRRNIVGHSDIAPDRKRDPGEKFPWAILAKAGIGLWTDRKTESHDIVADLAAIGYDLSLNYFAVIAAFQRRFRPDRINGVPDEETQTRAAAVRALMDNN